MIQCYELYKRTYRFIFAADSLTQALRIIVQAEPARWRIDQPGKASIFIRIEHADKSAKRP